MGPEMMRRRVFKTKPVGIGSWTRTVRPVSKHQPGNTGADYADAERSCSEEMKRCFWPTIPWSTKA